MRLYEIIGPEDAYLVVGRINRKQLYIRYQYIDTNLRLLRKPKNLPINRTKLMATIRDLIISFRDNVELLVHHCEYDMDKPAVQEYVKEAKGWLETSLQEARNLGVRI